MKRYASALLGVLVSAAFLALALRNVSFAELGRAAAALSLVWVLPMVVVVVVDLAIRAWRWRFLLSAARGPGGQPVPLPFWKLFQLEAIGLAVNNVLFLRLGEFARGYLAGVELGVSGVYGLATVVVERALDMMALLTLFVLAAGSLPETIPAALRNVAGLAVLGLGAGLVVVSVLDASIQKGGVWARQLAVLPPRLRSFVEQMALGSRALRSPAVAAPAAALSAVLWIVDAGVFWLAGRAMGLEPALGYTRSIVVLSTAAAASALPAVPGSFGAYEQFVKSLLVAWGVAEPVALAYAGIVHLSFYILVTAAGIIFMYRMGHTLAGLGRLVRERSG